MKVAAELEVEVEVANLIQALRVCLNDQVAASARKLIKLVFRLLFLFMFLLLYLEM